MSEEAKKPLPSSESAVPEELPILPVKGVVIYPEMSFPLLIGQERSVALVDEALIKDRTIGVIAVKNENAEEPGPDDLFNVGTVVVILKMLKLPNNALSVLVQGRHKFKVRAWTAKAPYLKAKISIMKDSTIKDVETEALMSSAKNLFSKVVDMSHSLPPELAIITVNVDEQSRLANFISANLDISLAEKQEILEIQDSKKRLERVIQFLDKSIKILELGQKIQAKVTGDMEKVQKDYLLREQLKAIKKELGEGDEKSQEINELKEKVKEAKMPPEVEKETMREIDRLALMSPAAAEYTVSRTYLDWLIELPWSKGTEDTLNIQGASKILDEDHYDLEKVKKRMLEYLSVRKLKADTKGPILCFVGPPGVGKTSLGMSIARALGRKFIRISLGGVRDEAEIRGHRRTYVGALPGRIIQGIRKAGTKNPVFMLDEIDKLGADFRGDPSAALLEVLDPEQNFSFSDHYLDVPFDLSKVMFITTANILGTIPPALMDRMEILELPGYTEEEKLSIAKKYLIPRQLKEHGLNKGQLSIDDAAVVKIIKDYTREAGLRNVEREIAAICRGIAREVAEGRKEPARITVEDIHRFLGPVRFFSEVAERTSKPGVATGLAWTPTGGDVLFVEATMMRGGKTLTLTGQLGDVMKESAQAALSYLRSRAKDFNIAEDFYEKNDIHVHVPAGAIPKDGPSAGVTMLTALASILTGRPVRPDIAMTGEITLRGMVLPVGGIKEKVLAAKRAGITTVVMPRKNEKDLEEVPASAKDGMTFKFVEEMGDVLSLTLRNK